MAAETGSPVTTAASILSATIHSHCRVPMRSGSIYSVQIINGDGSVAAVAYFFQDEFDNWAVFDKKGNVFH